MITFALIPTNFGIFQYSLLSILYSKHIQLLVTSFQTTQFSIINYCYTTTCLSLRSGYPCHIELPSLSMFQPSFKGNSNTTPSMKGSGDCSHICGPVSQNNILNVHHNLFIHAFSTWCHAGTKIFANLNSKSILIN